MRREVTHIMRARTRRPLLTCVIILTMPFAGCEDARKPMAAPTRPPAVTIARPLVRDYQPHADFTGRTEAVEEVEVRPRVSGFLESIFFQAGGEVMQGDVLFEIDARPYRAEVDRLEAEVVRAEAMAKQAEVEYARLKDLYEKESATQIEFERHIASRDSSKAQVAAAKAALDRARLDLEWTKVTAPIGGRISRNYVDAGNLVQGGIGSATLLTRIVRFDPMYAYIDMDERTVLTIQKLIRDGKMQGYRQQNCAARLGLAIEQGFPHEGGIDFVENKIDANTGTLRVRAVFPNSKLILSPGLFARVRILLGEPSSAIMISEKAISFDQGQRFVYVMNEKNIAEYRLIEVGDLEDGLRVIIKGVGPNDWVVVNGIQRVRPGSAVEPQRVDMAALSAPVDRTVPTTQPATSAASHGG